MNTTELLTLNSIISQSPGNIVSDMDGEKVMLNINKGKYYNLGQMGGEIWGMLEQPISIQELVQHLMKEYTVEAAECEKQVLSFLSLLYKEELIVVQ